jgi:hypothetical protein
MNFMTALSLMIGRLSDSAGVYIISKVGRESGAT